MPEENRQIVQVATEVLETVLDLLGVDASVNASAGGLAEDEPPEEPNITLDIEGDDLGILIGWHGQTLASLQYLVRLIVTCKMENHLPIVVDVNGYKQRRYEALRALATRIAEQVMVKKTPFALEPMAAYERRIIHVTLASHSHVITESTGYGDARKVVIMPKRL
ncbi:MAG: KH domain-containing protein [Chloroflexi bacterium]|nr:KH domain-containing protein [Chloroflexota bacterium]